MDQVKCFPPGRHTPHPTPPYRSVGPLTTTAVTNHVRKGSVNANKRTVTCVVEFRAKGDIYSKENELVN